MANGNTTVDLLLPGQLYGDRVNQVDVRFTKILQMGKARAQIGVDLYNMLNANPGLTYNQAFTGARRHLAASDEHPVAAVCSLQRDGGFLNREPAPSRFARHCARPGGCGPRQAQPYHQLGMERGEAYSIRSLQGI